MQRIPRSLLLAADIACFLVAAGASLWLSPLVRVWAQQRSSLASVLQIDDLRTALDPSQLAVLGIMMPVTLTVLGAMGLYRPIFKLSRTRIVAGAVVGPLAGLSAGVLMLFATRTFAWSRLLLFSTTVACALLMAAYRLLIRHYRRRRAAQGAYARSVAVIAAPDVVDYIAQHYRRVVPESAYQLVGRLAVAGEPASGATGGALPVLGRVDDLGDLLIHQPIQEVVAVLAANAPNDWIRDVIQQCDYFRVTLRIVPEALLVNGWSDLEVDFGSDDVRLPDIVLRTPTVDSDIWMVKRGFDAVVAVVLLLLLSPLLLLIAVAIKVTSPRLPIFYEWNVVGYHGRRFRGYKFTTMVDDADSRKADLMHLNEMSGPVFKIKADPRVTPLGRFLRKFSLNELPQLWSVVKGDMSLVGPRPAGPHELVGYERWHKRKLSVRPGITCLWQVRGRNQISSFDDWVRMDLEYIDNWSLWLDLKILMRTAWVVVRGTGS